MNELIKIKNSAYARYEELILLKDSLKKETFQYERFYVREFGDMILEVFRNKIECIRKKKMIEYYQAALNHGRSIDQDALQEYLRTEMAAFEEQLDNMIEDTQHAKNVMRISELDLLTIKRIYRRTARQIHPDINPITSKTPKLMELWQRVQTAYKCNDKEELQELESLVNTVLRQFGTDVIDLEIPDIDGKIAELEAKIREIRETDPYAYRYLLEDPSRVEEKKSSLSEELRSYKEYSEQLEQVLNGLIGNVVSFTWRMN